MIVAVIVVGLLIRMVLPAQMDPPWLYDAIITVVLGTAVVMFFRRRQERSRQ